MGWLAAWALSIATVAARPHLPAEWDRYAALAAGMLGLLGTTALLLAVASYALRQTEVLPEPGPEEASFPGGTTGICVLIGVGATAFTMVFLELVLFQTVRIFADYLTATSAISVSLLGVAVGGIVGYFTARRAPMDTMIGAIYSGDAAVRAIARWVEANSNWQESLMIVTGDHGHYLVVDEPAAFAEAVRRGR